MTKENHLKISLIVIGVGIAFFLAQGESFARSKGFGGFGSGRSFSGSKSFGKSKYKWAGKRTAKKSSAGKMSAAGRASYKRAKAAGTVFKSRTGALKAFKLKYASKYPVKFSQQPGIRPGYIRPNISLKGKKHKVFYKKGGYGYFIGSMWYWYSPFDDDFEADELMEEHDYYYGPEPGLSMMAVLGMGITLFLLMNILKSFVAAKGKGPARFG